MGTIEGPANILIVDKAADSRSFLSETLNRQGYVTHCVGAWHAALTALKSLTIDVVVLEHGFAQDDGLALIQDVKAIDPHLMVIVLTAQPEIEKIIRIMRGNGAFDVLIKPLEGIEALSDSIRNAMAQRRRLTRHQKELYRLMQSNRELQGRLAKNGATTHS